MFTLLSVLLFGQVAFAAGPWQATILGFPYPEGFTSAQFKIEPTVTPVYEATPAHIKILGTYQTAKQTASGTATPVTGLIVLKGFFSKKDWKLIEFGGTPIRFNKDGTFSLQVLIRSSKTQIKLVAIGPQGVKRDFFITMEFSDFNQWKDPKLRNASRPLGLSTTLGYTSTQYTETNQKNFSMGSLTLKVALSRSLGNPSTSRWDAGINVFGTLLPLTDNNPNATVRLLGANARIGFRITSVPSRWRFATMLGWYYTTMMVTVSTAAEPVFGFKNLAGPQAFPVLAYQLNNRHTLGTYIKYSPIWGGAGFLSLSNRELATGLQWNYSLSSKVRLTTAVDYSDFRLVISTVKIGLNTISFSTGLIF